MRVRHNPLAAAALIAILLASALVAASQTPAPFAGSARLATVLADLAQAAPQDQGDRPGGTRAALQIAGAPVSVQDALASRQLRIDAANRAQVYLLVREVSADVLRALESAGVAIEIAEAASRRVQARVPIDRLARVASLPFVDFIRLPSYAQRHVGRFVTEGDRIHNADVARPQFGVDGTGVTVGVISDGLKGLFATDCATCDGAPDGPIASGDLPAATGVRDGQGVLRSASGGITADGFNSDGDLEGLPARKPPCGFEGAGGEGTALLEIVHDLSPGARLRFANADTGLAFNQAVNALAAVSDVVVDDLGFYGEPADGQSAISQNTAAALNNPNNRIRTYITSVGNGADNHYFGTFVDSGVEGRRSKFIPRDGRFHQFQSVNGATDVLGLGPQPFNVISLPKNGEAVVILTWNDPAGRSANDYDLFLIREDTGQVVARSIDRQVGAQEAIEFVDYVNRGAEGRFLIAIQNVDNGAAPRDLNLFAFAPQCAFGAPLRLVSGRHERLNYNTESRSLSAQSDAGGTPAAVISVGAICSASALAASVFAGSDAPSESCNDQSHRTAQFYSSRGPTLDGRMKPDISGIDGVSITGAGQFGSPFFGTSAAAPHVAGIAALVLQAAPCLRAGGTINVNTARTTVRQILLSGADPIATQPDNTFGVGLANAQRSVMLARSSCQ